MQVVHNLLLRGKVCKYSLSQRVCVVDIACVLSLNLYVGRAWTSVAADVDCTGHTDTYSPYGDPGTSIH